MCKPFRVARSILCALPAAALFALATPAAHAIDPAGDTKSGDKQGKVDVNNPIRYISLLMKKAGKLLEALETGTPTQEEQKKALAELDRLIQLAEEASSSAQNQRQRQKQDKDSGSKPPQPKDSSGTSTGGSPMSVEADVMRAIRQKLGSEPPDLKEMWGKLPDAARDEILQLLSEKLPLQYKHQV